MSLKLLLPLLARLPSTNRTTEASVILFCPMLTLIFVYTYRFIIIAAIKPRPICYVETYFNILCSKYFSFNSTSIVILSFGSYKQPGLLFLEFLIPSKPDLNSDSYQPLRAFEE